MREWREDIAERLELPAEAAGVLKVSLSGKRRVLVENHRGILEYADDCIEVAGGALRLRIRGDGLEIKAMDRADLLVTGTIFSVELE
ncbi:MAG: YabP/YqfC family sporulation protein [Oscillospiraceae bacterium]